MGEEQVAVAVGVEVRSGYPHAGLRCSGVVHRRAPVQRRVREVAGAVVDPQEVGAAVVGDIEVNVTVSVEVVGDDAHARGARHGDPGRCGDVLEAAGAEVSVEAVAYAGEPGRWTVAPPTGGTAWRRGVDSEVQVVGNVEVEQAVAVDIRETGADGPALPDDAGVGGCVAEAAVTKIEP